MVFKVRTEENQETGWDENKKGKIVQDRSSKTVRADIQIYSLKTLLDVPITLADRDAVAPFFCFNLEFSMQSQWIHTRV